MQLAMLMDPARAHLVVRGHPIGQGCVGPPAWRCWWMGSESLQSCGARRSNISL